jgi:hypothetical protein
MVYGLYVISPESGLVSLRPPGSSPGVDPSVGGPGQHDFARPPLAALVRRSGRVHRSPPHVRDDAFAPPIEAGCAQRTIIFRKTEAIYFCTEGLTPLPINRSTDLPVVSRRQHLLWRTTEVPGEGSESSLRGGSCNDIQTDQQAAYQCTRQRRPGFPPGERRNHRYADKKRNELDRNNRR